MDKLRVRVYNVRFGDAILISVPDKGANGHTIVRHILLDFGNVQSGKGGDDSVFEPVIKDIQSVLNGQQLDLYVMTHEHLDHVQGLLYSAVMLNRKISARYAWLTASAAADYYTNHPDAKKKIQAAIAAYEAVKQFCIASYNADGYNIAGFLGGSPLLADPVSEEANPREGQSAAAAAKTRETVSLLG